MGVFPINNFIIPLKLFIEDRKSKTFVNIILLFRRRDSDQRAVCLPATTIILTE